MDLLDQGVLFAVSLAANFFSALAGGGAGLLQLPAIIFLGLPFAIALATHKVATVALGVGATLRHWQTGQFNWRLGLFILACGLPGVVLGAYWILDVPEVIAKQALGVLTLSLAIYSVVQKELGLVRVQKDFRRLQWLIGGLVLFLIGGLNGSLTSGTGLFVTLWLVRWFGLDYKLAVGYTLILVGFFWNGTGALVLGSLGEIAWDWLPALIMGSLLGGYLGAHFSIIKGNRWVKRAFEIMTFATGLALLWTA
jgi:uncharacterized membrane protein YfcA